MGNRMLQDSSGNTSSKRIAGMILVVVGVVGGAVGAWQQNAQLVDYGKWLAVSGAALLGIGVFERRV